jgi:hypothetical protein
MTRQGQARPGAAGQGEERQGLIYLIGNAARRGWVGQGWVWLGEAWHGRARQGRDYLND